MDNTLFQQDLISINQLTPDQIDLILAKANEFKQNQKNNLLENKIIAHCFFEPSTRTRLSFEAAALRLGAKVIGFSNEENLSIKKGESLKDTIRVISEYADLIIMRHAYEGSARLAAEISTKPVINAGDGANQHPTQALVDLFTIQECQQQVDGLHIALVGDLKYGRTIHSLTQLCSLYNIRLYLVSTENLSLPKTLLEYLKQQGIRFSFHQSLGEVIAKSDIIYLTRIQKERFHEDESALNKNKFILTEKLLEQAKPNLKILHPLPRLSEIDESIDETSYAYYFAQAANGVYVRAALLTLLLNEA